MGRMNRRNLRNLREVANNRSAQARALEARRTRGSSKAGKAPGVTNRTATAGVRLRYGRDAHRLKCFTQIPQIAQIHQDLCMRDINDVTHAIIGSALRIHSKLGPGLFESVYHAVLVRDLRRKGFPVESKKRIPIVFEDMLFDKAFYADIVVDRRVIVKVKSERALDPVYPKQLMTYLRLLDVRLGLLLNFGTSSLGIKRIVNGLDESAQSTESA